MTFPHQRHRDPSPISRGGEVAFVVLCGVVLALSLAALAGLGLASALFGGGLVWPHGRDTMVHTVGGLIAGHPGRGLPVVEAGRVPGPVAVYACVAVCELVLITVGVVGAVLVVPYRRPGDARGGMATRWETKQALGVARLRRSQRLIRPDLCRQTTTAMEIAKLATEKEVPR